MVVCRTDQACRDRWSYVWQSSSFCKYHEYIVAEAAPPAPPDRALASRQGEEEHESAVASTQPITVPSLSSSVVFRVPTDKKGNATSHYKRHFPQMWTVTWGKEKDNLLLDLEERCTHLKDAGQEPHLLLRGFWDSFLGSRTHGRVHRDDLEVHYTLPWDEDGDLHRIGIWFRLPFRTAMPPFPDCVDVATWRTRDGDIYTRCMHSSNYYSFESSMKAGLQPGPATKSSLQGIYMYPTTTSSLARSSSGYRVYSCFSHDGYFWSLVYECAFGKFLSHAVGKMAAGNGQLAAKLGTFHVVAIWMHCLHTSEMPDCGRAGLTVNAEFFDHLYEIAHET